MKRESAIIAILLCVSVLVAAHCQARPVGGTDFAAGLDNGRRSAEIHRVLLDATSICGGWQNVIVSSKTHSGATRLLLAQCDDCNDTREKVVPPQVICDKHYRFAIPGCNAGPPVMRRIVDHKIQLLPPPGPDAKNGNGKDDAKSKNGDAAKNGDNGNGEKEEEAVPAPDRVWDAVQQG